jgi:hypothetical protein
MLANAPHARRLGRHNLLGHQISRRALFRASVVAILATPLLGERSRAQEGETVAVPLNEPPFVTGTAEGEIPKSIGQTVAWRVVQDVAEPQGQARDEVRALGFGVPIADPLLTTNVDTGNVARFNPGHVFYVIEDSTTRRESLSGETIPYVRIALVPPGEVTDPGGDTLLFAGEAFVLPNGVSDLRISARAYEIAEGDRIPFGGYRTVLIHAVAGSIAYEAIYGQSGLLLAGESATVVIPENGGPDSNRVDIVGRDPDGSRYVVAMVDPPLG